MNNNNNKINYQIWLNFKIQNNKTNNKIIKISFMFYKFNNFREL